MDHRIYQIGIGLLAVISLGMLGWNIHLVTAEDSSKTPMIHTGIIRWEQAESSQGNYGEIRIYHKGDTLGTVNTLSGMAVIKPGESLHPAHRHENEEFLVITKGSGTWSVDGKEYPAREGDVLYVEPWVMHGLVNTGKEPLTFFVARWTSKGVPYPKEPTGDHGR